MIFLVCGTTCVVASTKSNCDSCLLNCTSSPACYSSFYTGTYFAFQEVNGQLWYTKQATLNGLVLPDWFIFILFVPELNSWTVSKTYGHLCICMAT